MSELVEYDLTSSSSLFDSLGLITKSTKSDLMNEIAKKHLIDIMDHSKDMHVGYIADVMANVRKMIVKELTNFGEFSGGILDYIQISAQGADRIDYVFDSYFDISIKNSKRKRREPISPIELNAVSEDTPLPVQMEWFWTANRNKHNLDILLHQTVISTH